MYRLRRLPDGRIERRLERTWRGAVRVFEAPASSPSSVRWSPPFAMHGPLGPCMVMPEG